MKLAFEKQLADFIHRRRGQMTFEELSRVTSIPTTTLYRLQEGQHAVTTRVLADVCSGFRCTLHDIFPDQFSPAMVPAPKIALEDRPA